MRGMRVRASTMQDGHREETYFPCIRVSILSWRNDKLKISELLTDNRFRLDGFSVIPSEIS